MKPSENMVQITKFLLVLHTYGLIHRVPQLQFFPLSAQEPADEKEQNIGYRLLKETPKLCNENWPEIPQN
jgi:hypothetical protein